jgi:hypothetical protein
LRIVGAIGDLWFDIAVLVACFAAAEQVPSIVGTIAFIVLQKTKRRPIILRNPREELRRESG